ncbi:MAG TPA: prolyl oligopeptidase family serine peptidase [Verrucomicrobiae bacterium]|nr:prolyl oligopeptidase family serine peptidase [Verrucomicrobiae bacterium]
MKALACPGAALLLCLTQAAGMHSLRSAPAADDPPPRTSFSDPHARFTVPDKPYVVLRRGPLEAVVVDNRAVDDDKLPGHRAGYHGLGSLKHDKQPRNLFVPSYAGLNFEHIHDGTVQDSKVLFEPRNAPMQLHVIDDHTAELYQAPTPHWGLESCLRYQLLDNGVIELTFECVPRRDTFKNGYIGLFWASYVHQPESLDIHFIGCPNDDASAVPAWVRGVTPAHGELPTHLARGDQRDFAHDPAFPLTLVFNRSRHRYAEPWYFGVCRGMAFAEIFRASDQVRLSQSPSGGGTGNPAWDFQWFIPNYRIGQRYQLVMRAFYRPVANPGDEAGTRKEVSGSVNPLLNFATSPRQRSSRSQPAGDLSKNLGSEKRSNSPLTPSLSPSEGERVPEGRVKGPSNSSPGQTLMERGSAPDIIAPFFQPPSEFAGQFGAYRSPLLFNDGTLVKSAADWPRRRAEILREWNELMGPWPPVFERPKLEVLSETRRENFSQRRVRLEIAPNQTEEGWLLVPVSQGPFPAVLVVYYEPETSVGLSTNALRDFGYQLTRRGFVSLSIGTPGGNAWKPETGTAQCQPLSFHAYVAANCWRALASLPEVDRARIGVVGHSYGGKWALFAAALWDRFAAVAVSDPGIVFDETRPNVNYWEPWYLGYDPAQKRPKPGIPTADNPRTGPYKKMVEAGRDLHELHALIAPRPFLVSGGAEDPPARWTALNHAVAVNKLLGFTNRVAMTSRKGHTPTEESNARLYAFFEHFLGNAARSP